MAMRNPLADVKPMSVGVVLLTALWVVFQWRDPTPPPALDQGLIAAIGAWFASEAMKGTGKGKRRSVKINKDGTVSVSELPEDEKAENDKAEED